MDKSMVIQLIGFRTLCCYWLCQFDGSCLFNDQPLLIIINPLFSVIFSLFPFIAHLFLIISTFSPSSLVRPQHFYLIFLRIHYATSSFKGDSTPEELIKPI